MELKCGLSRRACLLFPHHSSLRLHFSIAPSIRTSSRSPLCLIGDFQRGAVWAFLWRLFPPAAFGLERTSFLQSNSFHWQQPSHLQDFLFPHNISFKMPSTMKVSSTILLLLLLLLLVLSPRSLLAFHAVFFNCLLALISQHTTHHHCNET